MKLSKLILAVAAISLLSCSEPLRRIEVNGKEYYISTNNGATNRAYRHDEEPYGGLFYIGSYAITGDTITIFNPVAADTSDTIAHGTFTYKPNK